MNIYNRTTLVDYWRKHSDARTALELWYHDVKSLKWQKPNDIKKDYSTADIIPNNRVVFDIKGNKYRLVAEINYQKGWLFIKFVGTHSEYDKIDATTINKY
jgi:mRNA interferase HigB